tara:strand:- start:2182 stop:2298 length:117 start_codon:yes stop_codon:yes gene_type:complete
MYRLKSTLSGHSLTNAMQIYLDEKRLLKIIYYNRFSDG